MAMARNHSYAAQDVINHIVDSLHRDWTLCAKSSGVKYQSLAKTLRAVRCHVRHSKEIELQIPQKTLGLDFEPWNSLKTKRE